jgi:hypothetical protein
MVADLPTADLPSGWLSCVPTEIGAMVITAIDSGLEQLLRVSLPLPADLGDVSFDAPDRSWGAQLSRVTVNLFLFDVNRSAQPPRPLEQRTRADGQIERRPPQSLVQLTYLVTAWAGNTRDEHQLLGDVLGCLLRHQVLPPEHLSEPIVGSVQLALASSDGRNPGELWSSLDARLKPAFRLDVTAAVEVPWGPTAAPVERIEGLVAPYPTLPPPAAASDFSVDTPVRPPLARHRNGAAVVTEGRPGVGA